MLCKCKIKLFIEPGFIQNGITFVLLKPLLSFPLQSFASNFFLPPFSLKFKDVLFANPTSQEVNRCLFHQL